MSCKKMLEEEVYSLNWPPNNFLTTRAGLEKLLFSTYALTADISGFRDYTRDCFAGNAY